MNSTNRRLFLYGLCLAATSQNQAIACLFRRRRQQVCQPIVVVQPPPVVQPLGVRRCIRLWNRTGKDLFFHWTL
jgi:hypothetical protein